MTVHVSLEQLSSYLDLEVAERERIGLEEHLHDCPSCRGRLDGLRAVVARLERLEQQAPPSDLALLVGRQVAAEADRSDLRSRLEQTLKTLFVQPSLTPVFGLVVALALILYLFSFGVARHQGRGTRVVVPPTVPAVDPGLRTVAGVEFTLADGIWIERGLDPSAPFRVLELSGEVPSELVPFAELGARVRLMHRGEPVELIFPRPDPQ
jgi:anti-sigma factor RsiW